MRNKTKRNKNMDTNSNAMDLKQIQNPGQGDAPDAPGGAIRARGGRLVLLISNNNKPTGKQPQWTSSRYRAPAKESHPMHQEEQLEPEEADLYS